MFICSNVHMFVCLYVRYVRYVCYVGYVRRLYNWLCYWEAGYGRIGGDEKSPPCSLHSHAT